MSVLGNVLLINAIAFLMDSFRVSAVDIKKIKSKQFFHINETYVKMPVR